MCTLVATCVRLIKTSRNVDFSLRKTLKRSGDKCTPFSPFFYTLVVRMIKLYFRKTPTEPGLAVPPPLEKFPNFFLGTTKKPHLVLFFENKIWFHLLTLFEITLILQDSSRCSE